MIFCRKSSNNFTRIFCLIGFFSLATMMSGCSIFDAPKSIPSVQPGDFLTLKMKEQGIVEQSQTETLIINSNTHFPKINKELQNNTSKAAKLLISINEEESIVRAIRKLAKLIPAEAEELIVIALRLYPIDAYRIVDGLYLEESINAETIESAAILADLEPSKIFSATAFGNQDYHIEPLIHSASITLFYQTESSKNKMWYKSSDSSQWLQAYSLQWEPVAGSFSGSIVHLEPNTQYEVKIQISDSSEAEQELLYTFKTRTNKPNIDPDKIYYLSDIYFGGQLDLEALGIEGSENGWAKIIGDGVIVEASEGDSSAINIGSQNYVMFENITVKGGSRYGIYSYKAHHIWIDGCDISEWGRIATDTRNGKGYLNEQSTNPINYDSGIYLERSGVVVVENCEIHSPNGQANHWGNGHPNGPNAMQVWGYHDEQSFQGQYIIRNNRFYGTPEKRFNDVIEGRGNFKRYGGFLRDSAIYNNYLAYANDDLIEIDGGQSNVLVYNNELTQGYAGISTAPNMIGPSYIFNNYIHDLGDERDKEWTAIKMGGLMSAPAGITNLFENLIVTKRNGIAASGVNGDSTFWVNARNNIIITRWYANMVGYNIYDKHLYEGSEFVNNVLYNLQIHQPFVKAIINEDFYHPSSESEDKINEILDTSRSFELNIEPRFVIPNFSTIQINDRESSKSNHTEVDFYNVDISPFANQDALGLYSISDSGNALELEGNTWKSISLIHKIKANTILEVEVKTNGIGEIAGIAFENDNKLTSGRLFKFSGSQKWVKDSFKYTKVDEFELIKVPVGDFITGDMDRLVLVSDDDDPNGSNAKVTFKNVKIYDKVDIPLDVAKSGSPSHAEPLKVEFNQSLISSFDNQDRRGKYAIKDNGNSIEMTGNLWKSLLVSYNITSDTYIEVDIMTNGYGEIAGIAVENDNKLTATRLFKFAGRQRWQQDDIQYTRFNEFETMVLPIGTYLTGYIDRLVLVLDDDKPNGESAEATFKNIRIYEKNASHISKNIINNATVKIGIKQ